MLYIDNRVFSKKIFAIRNCSEIADQIKNWCKFWIMKFWIEKCWKCQMILTFLKFRSKFWNRRIGYTKPFLIYTHILSNVELQNVEIIGYVILLIIKMFSTINDERAYWHGVARCSRWLQTFAYYYYYFLLFVSTCLPKLDLMSKLFLDNFIYFNILSYFGRNVESSKIILTLSEFPFNIF